MKVLFLQNIKGVAQIGDIKDVSDGYARNFLLPRKMAKPANAVAVKEAEELKKQREALAAKDKEQATTLIAQLNDVVIEITEDASDEGHLYGSIGSGRIADELKKQKGIAVRQEDMIMLHNLKTVGEHDVRIEPFKDISATIKVRISSTKIPA